MDDTDHALFPRFSAELVATALKDTPVVMVAGPRQCGKTTLVRDLVGGKREFITMDDDTVLAAARSDPTGLVRALDRTTIDEVQRVPNLLRAIKKSVDEDRRAGRFLLTGSANILTLPQVSESLAGRMEIVSLLPLSRAEIRGKKPGFLKAAFLSIRGTKQVTVGGDKGYDTADFVAECRNLKVTPHVAQNLGRLGGSAIDARTTQHPGYAISQKKRKRVEECFGWLKTIALLRKVRHRGIFKVGWVFTFAAAAYNLVRMRNLAIQTT